MPDAGEAALLPARISASLVVAWVLWWCDGVLASARHNYTIQTKTPPCPSRVVDPVVAIPAIARCGATGGGLSRMGRDAGGAWLVNRRARGPQSLTRRGGGVQQRPQAPADPKVSHEQVGAGTTTGLGQAAGERCGRRGGWEVCVGAVADGIGQVPLLRYLRWSRRRVGVGEGKVGGCR